MENRHAPSEQASPPLLGTWRVPSQLGRSGPRPALPAARLYIGQLGAPPGSRAPIGRGCPTPGKGSEAESRIGGPAIPGSWPRAPPAAASPLWRRPCSPPRRGRPPGSPAAATAAACAVASAFPPAFGRAPPAPCFPLRCGKGPPGRVGARQLTASAPPLPPLPLGPGSTRGAEAALPLRAGRVGARSGSLLTVKRGAECALAPECGPWATSPGSRLPGQLQRGGQLDRPSAVRSPVCETPQRCVSWRRGGPLPDGWQVSVWGSGGKSPGKARAGTCCVGGAVVIAYRPS